MPVKPSSALKRLAAVGVVGGLLALPVDALGQEFTSRHKPCEISIDKRGARMCYLPNVKAPLTCDLSLGQPRPQCVTKDGHFADCIYRVVTQGDAPTVYCAVPETMAEQSAARIVLTDADFGGAKEIVRRRRAERPAEEEPTVPVAADQAEPPRVVLANEDTYRGVLRSCEDAWEKISAKITQATGEHRGSVVGSMAGYMQNSCRTPRGVIFDRKQRSSFCEHVTGWVQNLGLQVLASADSIRSTYRAVLREACEQ